MPDKPQPTNPWLLHGLGWASLDRPEAHRRLASALLRWRLSGPAARGALRALVLWGHAPSEHAGADLLAGRLANEPKSPTGWTPTYPGAALVALEQLRSTLEAEQAQHLLAWYRGERERVVGVYEPSRRRRPHGKRPLFDELERLELVVHHEGRTLRSTPRGWAVAVLADEAEQRRGAA